MRVVLTDGSELRCENFKAIDPGVLLTKDKKRKKVIGFVPHGEVRYVVPDDLDVVTPAQDPDPNARRGDDAGADRRTGIAETDRDVLAGRPPGAEKDPAVDSDTVASGDEPAVAPEAGDLRRLGGLGATYADRLRAAGYGRLSDLAAAADPVAVAEAASVAPGRARRWVDAAVRLTGPTDGTDEAADGTVEPTGAGPGTERAEDDGDAEGDEAGADSEDEAEEGEEDATGEAAEENEPEEDEAEVTDEDPEAADGVDDEDAD
jgi:hypothetical protein